VKNRDCARSCERLLGCFNFVPLVNNREGRNSRRESEDLPEHA